MCATYMQYIHSWTYFTDFTIFRPVLACAVHFWLWKCHCIISVLSSKMWIRWRL